MGFAQSDLQDRNEPDNLVRIGICYHDMMEWNGIVWFGLGRSSTILPKKEAHSHNSPFPPRPPSSKKNAKFEASLTQALRKRISVSIPFDFIFLEVCGFFFFFSLPLLSLSTDVAGTKLFVCGVCVCGTCNHTHIFCHRSKKARDP